ncbi:hypothetical protein IE077_003023 [Cardiosporidium cionae]|uniref:Uncharacterized protein n=1 Tax=Cardiosporidium cionae TaxID=476202 RepID=A0ABQ7J9E3_9APIC|nr:hypothetical protein IE077_003023 [Cardiosporidium cionae]|eukprot:KAF8820576.1 hypothetical protein IE077_003023 [Cardiosporidium cionae]
MAILPLIIIFIFWSVSTSSGSLECGVAKSKLSTNQAAFPLCGDSTLELDTITKHSYFGARIRKRLSKGLTATISIDSLPSLSDKKPVFQLREKISLAGETSLTRHAKVSADVSFNFPSNLVEVDCAAEYKIFLMNMGFDTEKFFKTLGATYFHTIGSRRITLAPSHCFVTGDSMLNFASDLHIPTKEIATAVQVNTIRTKNGTIDALVKLIYTFNEGRDTFSPSIRLLDKSMRYDFEHKFKKYGYLKANLDGVKKVSLEWLDPSQVGGQWIARGEFPISEPHNGKFSFKRAMSF